MKPEEQEQIRTAFREAVNMSVAELKRWLAKEESKSVGWAGGKPKSSASGPESVGHKSGKRIVEIEGKKATDLTEADYAHMKKVVGYVHRHLAQRPKGDIEQSRWRFSLMNWGHDPLKTQ